MGGADRSPFVKYKRLSRPAGGNRTQKGWWGVPARSYESKKQIKKNKINRAFDTLMIKLHQELIQGSETITAMDEVMSATHNT